MKFIFEMHCRIDDRTMCYFTAMKVPIYFLAKNFY